jgi:hypothetical protein
MNGELRFNSLSHFKQIEDGKVRGDDREGSISYQPIGGFMGHNDTFDQPLHFPNGSSFTSGVNTEDIFILCASNSITDKLRIGFKAKACVQILRPGNLRDRIEYALPRTATVLAEKVTYYSLADAMGTRWYFADRIAFSKVEEGYSWQDEFRFVFTLGDALHHGNTAQKVVIPNQPPGTALPPPPPIPRHYDIKVKALGSICKLHIF